MKILTLILFLHIPFVSFAVTTDELLQIHPMTTAQRGTLFPTIVDGMLVYDTTANRLYVRASGTWKALLFAPKVFEKTGNYTLTQSDNRNILTFNSSTAMTLTIPSGFPVGYNVSVYQAATGKVNIVGSGTTVKNRLSRFKTAGKDAGVGIVSTATDVYHLTGDLKK